MNAEDDPRAGTVGGAAAGRFGHPVVNTHVHLPPNFSAFETAEDAVRPRRAEGVRVMGVSNFHDQRVYARFAEAARAAGIVPLFGLEFISLDDGLRAAGMRINDPANPGRVYLCGKGVDPFAPPTETTLRLAAEARRTDEDRMRPMVARLRECFAGRRAGDGHHGRQHRRGGRRAGRRSPRLGRAPGAARREGVPGGRVPGRGSRTPGIAARAGLRRAHRGGHRRSGRRAGRDPFAPDEGGAAGVRRRVAGLVRGCLAHGARDGRDPLLSRPLRTASTPSAPGRTPAAELAARVLARGIHRGGAHPHPQQAGRRGRVRRGVPVGGDHRHGRDRAQHASTGSPSSRGASTDRCPPLRHATSSGRAPAWSPPTSTCARGTARVRGPRRGPERGLPGCGGTHPLVRRARGGPDRTRPRRWPDERARPPAGGRCRPAPVGILAELIAPGAAVRPRPRVLAGRRWERVGEGRRRPVHQAQRRTAGDARGRRSRPPRHRAAARPARGQGRSRRRPRTRTWTRSSGPPGPRGSGEAGGRRPSVELLFHALLPGAVRPPHAPDRAQRRHLHRDGAALAGAPVRRPGAVGPVHGPRPAPRARDRGSARRASSGADRPPRARHPCSRTTASSWPPTRRRHRRPSTTWLVSVVQAGRRRPAPLPRRPGGPRPGARLGPRRRDRRRRCGGCSATVDR